MTCSGQLLQEAGKGHGEECRGLQQITRTCAVPLTGNNKAALLQQPSIPQHKSKTRQPKYQPGPASVIAAFAGKTHGKHPASAQQFFVYTRSGPFCNVQVQSRYHAVHKGILQRVCPGSPSSSQQARLVIGLAQ